MSTQILRQQLRSHRNVSKRKLERAVKEAANALKDMSLEFVPTQTGALAASAKVVTHTRPSGEAVATVLYTAPYAIYVHEDLDKAHGKEFNEKYKDQIASASGNDPYWFNRREQEQAKFLEMPAKVRRAELRAIIRKAAES